MVAVLKTVFAFLANVGSNPTPSATEKRKVGLALCWIVRYIAIVRLPFASLDYRFMD
jgi:hypothetical protein